jgi:hypothetical protein
MIKNNHDDVAIISFLINKHTLIIGFMFCLIYQLKKKIKGH